MDKLNLGTISDSLAGARYANVFPGGQQSLHGSWPLVPGKRFVR